MIINEKEALALKEWSFQQQIFQIFAFCDPCNPLVGFLEHNSPAQIYLTDFNSVVIFFSSLVVIYSLRGIYLFSISVFSYLIPLCLFLCLYFTFPLSVFSLSFFVYPIFSLASSVSFFVCLLFFSCLLYTIFLFLLSSLCPFSLSLSFFFVSLTFLFYLLSLITATSLISLFFLLNVNLITFSHSNTCFAVSSDSLVSVFSFL